MMKLQETDVSSAFNVPLPKQKEVSIDTTMQLTHDDLHGLLQKLSLLLKDHDVISSMWPEAQTESEIFQYLHIEFDSHEEKVKLATAATNVKGKPVH